MNNKSKSPSDLNSPSLITFGQILHQKVMIKKITLVSAIRLSTECSLIIIFQFFSTFLLKAIRKQTALYKKLHTIYVWGIPWDLYHDYIDSFQIA